ncbi:hypothetical protein H2198_007910 [Neophaeococcomyces mojaviensis]|uniref:Uncharacterized protein n=1 Tax=Neophaeococcomyces mojaviensis TaxID=3383035 RepID=A0ACC2ZYQ9_9EURO|nr:hypothetical protein H2198_007910 [Knufia sp. JES_112]
MSTSFAEWVSSSSTGIFWISGKHGPGKSVLMKYISEDLVIKARLPPNGTSGWIVVTFFFDVRQSTLIGNSTEGMLRSILHQVLVSLQDDPAIADILANTKPRITADNLSHNQLKELITRIVPAASSKILVLVDGLDEFRGNRRLLMELLLWLGQLENSKLCLASRLEPMITVMLHGATSIQMSDHNGKGIEQNLNFAIDRFQPLLESLNIGTIRKAVLEKANGVFLWVHIVTEEILQAVVSGATHTEILEVLTGLPDELDDLYQTILSFMSLDRKIEAAIIYQLVVTAVFEVTLDVLQSAIYVLVRQFDLGKLVPDIQDISLFTRRFHATTGGFLELVPPADSLPEEPSNLRFEKFTIRLLHETVGAFTLRSQWTDELLRSKFDQLLQDDFWQILWFKILNLGHPRVEAGEYKFLNTFYDESLHTKSMHINTPDERNPLAVYEMLVNHSFTDTVIRYAHSNEQHKHRRLLPILNHGLKHFPILLAGAHQIGDPGLPPILKNAHESLKLLLTRFQHALPSQGSRAAILPPRQILTWSSCDLFLAICHSNLRFVLEQSHRLGALEDSERSNLLVSLLLLAKKKTEMHLSQFEHLPIVLTQLLDIIDLIMSYSHNFTTFHVAVFFILGYGNQTNFIKKLNEWLLQRPNRDLALGTLEDWTNLDLQAVSLYSPFSNWIWRPPLSIWACEWRSDFPCLSNDPAPQLSILLSLRLNHENSTNNFKTHALHHLVNHVTHAGSDMCDGVTKVVFKKLYLLEQHGASFDSVQNSETCLQILRRRRHEFKDDWAWNLRVYEYNFWLMLEHKQEYDHLPLQLGMDRCKRWDDVFCGNVEHLCCECGKGICGRYEDPVGAAVV